MCHGNDTHTLTKLSKNKLSVSALNLHLWAKGLRSCHKKGNKEQV